MSAKVYFDASSLDVAAKGYFTAIKEALKPEKFHVQAPTPQLLQKAQKAAVDLRRPIPRDGQGRILPHPSRGTKLDIFKKEDFKEVDNHSLNAPNSLLSANIEELVDYLVGAYENDDVSAVRAIFRWISGQDLRHYEILPNVSPNCAAYYLNELKSGRGRYDKLFNLMCKHAKIPSATISGHSKGIGYNVGDPLTDSTHNMWNAVLLGEDWYLIDVHWASRKVSGVESEEWQLMECSQQKKEHMTTPQDIYEFDEFYFLTNPEEFIYSHFPDQEVWQLLARPMTYDEFKKVILLKPRFFQFGLKIKSHPWCTLKSVDGAVNIELTTEREDLSFSSELYRSNKVDSGQQRLQKYLFLERNPEEKKVCVEIRFPTTGKFKAEIYAKDSKSKLEWLCSYVLYCEKPEVNCMPLPTNLRSEWGPGVDMSNAGIVPLTHKRGKIFVNSVETQIKFKLKLEVDLIAQLMTVDEENLEKYVLLGVIDNIATVNVRVPQKGQYALCLFAKTDPYQQQFVNICNYLVRCTEDFGEVESYPQTNNSRVGPLEMFYKLGLKTTDTLPGLSTVSRDGTFTFSVDIPNGIDYFPRMTLSTKDDFSDYVGWYRQDDNVQFTLRFPKAGFYKFSLFAKSENDEGGYPEVLCLILEVPWPMTYCLPFPKRFTNSKDIYQIFSPNQRLLAAGKTEKVKVFLPGVEEVAFIDGGSWTHLTRTDDGLWTGQVTPNGETDTISMAAKLLEDANNFSAIMSFEVIPEKDLNHLFLAQKLSREVAEQKYLEQISLRDNASKKSQGNSMMNQIQRIAKMKQQNLDDETLQRIELQVDESEFDDSDINGQLNDQFTDYLADQSGDYDSSVSEHYNHNVNDPISPEPSYLTKEDIDEDDEDEENEQNCQISVVDINWNDIIKSSVHEADIDQQVESELHAEPFIDDSGANLKEHQEITQENIPLQFGAIQDHISEETEEMSKIKQSSLEKSFSIYSDDLCQTLSSEDEDGLSPSIQKLRDDSMGDVKHEFMHRFNAAPPPPPRPSSSEGDFTEQLVKEVDQISETKPSSLEKSFSIYSDDLCHSISSEDEDGLSPSIQKLRDDSMGDVKVEFMHQFNAAPPPPPRPSLSEGDFTDQLVKKVADMEESVEKEEFALKNFTYQELKGMDEGLLRQRPLSSKSDTINQPIASSSIEDKKPLSIVQPLARTNQEDEEEVPLIKIAEYFVYFISLWSILYYVFRILSWRPY